MAELIAFLLGALAGIGLKIAADKRHERRRMRRLKRFLEEWMTTSGEDDTPPPTFEELQEIKHSLRMWPPRRR